MRVGIATVQVPFIRGGADVLVEDLAAALRTCGHEVDILTMPFQFFPPAEVRRSMRQWQEQPCDSFNGYRIDRLVCMKFPSLYAPHPAKVAWMMHQHRSVYDLWDHNRNGQDPEEKSLKDEITRADTEAFRACRGVYGISRNVANRIRSFNGVEAGHLHPPLRDAELYYAEPARPFIFFPSRFETLKRQSLLIQAMARVKSNVYAILAGDGGQFPACMDLLQSLGLHHRVKLVGRISEEEKRAFLGQCLGVFFGPQDEDYGYVTLEAMASSKPVITCSDSGGPLEFVSDGDTGLVTSPDPAAVADAIDRLAGDPRRAAVLGSAGRQKLDDLDMNWTSIVEALLA